MKVRVEPGAIAGSITAPPSKSMSQRAYAAALLHKGSTTIQGAGKSGDELAARHIIQQLGATVSEVTAGSTQITGNGIIPLSGSISCNESGLSARLFTPIAALSAQAIRVEGTGSLLLRPMEGFEAAFTALGLALPGFSGHIPFTVQGPMAARSVHINAAGGSQLLSGLLFALSYVATEAITITVTDLKSKPYIDLTLDVLAHFGKPITHDQHRSFYIDPATYTHQQERSITIEGDWSSAAALLVAGAIAGDITVKGLNSNSRQADRAILQVLHSAGANMVIHDDSIAVKRSGLQAFEFDATDCPDLFPALAILAACCEGESYIQGVHRLFHKESNRAESISEMLQNFDVPFSVEDDALCVYGVDKLQGTIIDSYNDHRIVMAAAIGALRANGPVDIFHPEAVGKSYPDFFGDIALCGGKCTFTTNGDEHIRQ